LKTDFGGLPIAFHLTAGEASDSRNFEMLLDTGPDINPRAVLGDKGYDSKSNREAARERGICPAIPYRSNTKDIPTFFPKTSLQRALKSMRVMFATPCYISAVTLNYVASIFSLTLDSAHLGLPCILHLHSESLITRARNKMVIKFLSEDFTHLFWIDSDIAFSSQSVFRLLLADRDVAAVYGERE
jgi:hypothetical protein